MVIDVWRRRLCSWYSPCRPGGYRSRLLRREDRRRLLPRLERLEARCVLSVPTVSISLAIPGASEQGPQPAIFRLERTDGDVDQALTVDLSYDGTATAGVDYIVLDQEAHFEPGAATTHVAVLPKNDARNEGTENIQVSILPGADYEVGASQTATADLADAFFPGLGGLIEIQDSRLPADISYLDASISPVFGQDVLNITLGLNNVFAANPQAFEIYIDADNNPHTGDYRQGHIAGAEYRAESVVLGLGDVFQLYRLPTQAGQQEQFVGQASLSRNGNFLQMSINTSNLNFTTTANVMAFARRNMANRVAGNGDRAPDYGWLQAGTNNASATLVVPRAGRTVLQSLSDSAGDNVRTGTLDIVGADLVTIADQVIVDIEFAQAFDPTSISLPNLFGAISIDSDRSVATGAFPGGGAIPSFGVDAILFWQFSTGTAVHEFAFEPSGADNVVFGDPNNDGRWHVAGNFLRFAFSQSAVDAALVEGTGIIPQPPFVTGVQTRLPTDGRMNFKLTTLLEGPADLAPDGASFFDAAAGKELEPLQFDQPIVAPDPLEMANPISPFDLLQVEAEVLGDNLVVRGSVASFLNTTEAGYSVLLDIDSNTNTGFRVADPLNPANSVGAEYIMDLFAIDGGISQITFAVLTRPDGVREAHESAVVFQPVAIAGTGGSFTSTIPLQLLRRSGTPLGDELRLLVSSSQPFGAGHVDLAPQAPMVISLGDDNPPAIPPDRFEENDSFEAATDLGTGDQQQQGLTIHGPDDIDLYRWTAPADGRLQIDVLFSHAIGDLDIALLDAEENEIEDSNSTTDDEQIVAEVTGGQTYWIAIFGYDGATHDDYSLIIDGPEVTSSLVGDYNNNGRVEQGDLDLVLLHWGQDGTQPPANWVGQRPTGVIDQDDLDAVLLNWGTSAADADG